MRSRKSLAFTIAILLVACGGGDESTATVAAEAATGEDPCALATPETVAEAFGAASASREPGVARNCHFTIEGGVAPSAEVFHYGSSDGWDGIKSGYEENRGGVTSVNVGDEAYQPNDVGPYELVVRSGDVVFAVAVQQGQGGPEIEAAILDLAGAIAGG